MKSASVKVIESWNVFAIALTSLTDVTWKFLRPSPLAPLPKGEKAGVLSYLQRKLLFTLHRKLLLTYQLDMVDLAYSLTLACQNSV